MNALGVFSVPQVIQEGGTPREELEHKCAQHPEFAAAMSRGMYRWSAWTGQLLPAEVDDWMTKRGIP